MKSVVVGLGEVGLPLFSILKKAHPNTFGYDKYKKADGFLSDVDLYPKFPCDVVHLCIPFNDKDSYVKEVFFCCLRFNPLYIVIHSTVEPGTTHEASQRISSAGYRANVYHSPVSGKHSEDGQMAVDLMKYPKILAFHRPQLQGKSEGDKTLEQYFRIAGFNISWFSCSLSSEIAKLVATNYVGYLIAYRQEVERIADTFCVPEEEISDILHWDCDDFTKPRYPGVIGGHCVIPNLEISERVYPSDFWKIITMSNLKKIDREKNGPASNSSIQTKSLCDNSAFKSEEEKIRGLVKDELNSLLKAIKKSEDKELMLKYFPERKKDV